MKQDEVIELAEFLAKTYNKDIKWLKTNLFDCDKYFIDFLKEISGFKK